MAERRQTHDAPRVVIADRAAWRAWLSANHATSGPIWLVYAKRVRGQAVSLTYDDIVEESLCFGWIDSLPRKLSATQSMLYIAPRKAKSVWSALNKRRVAALEAQGLIAPAGAAKIEAAKRDGSWDVLNEAEAGVMPADLRAALEANARARQCFEAFPPSAKKGILTWLALAKRAETRTARVREVVRLAAKNVRANTPGAKG